MSVLSLSKKRANQQQLATPPLGQNGSKDTWFGHFLKTNIQTEDFLCISAAKIIPIVFGRNKRTSPKTTQPLQPLQKTHSVVIQTEISPISFGRPKSGPGGDIRWGVPFFGM